MELKVTRNWKKSEYTIGRMYVNGEFFCNTLEDKVRDLPKEKKVPGKTAIPAGRYRVILTTSARFKRLLPLLLNVPYFEGIRIHSGNTAADTEGCILVGDNTVKGKVLNSRARERELMDILMSASAAGDSIYIDIE